MIPKQPRCPNCDTRLEGLHFVRTISKLYLYDGEGYRQVETWVNESKYSCPHCGWELALDEEEADEVLKGPSEEELALELLPKILEQIDRGQTVHIHEIYSQGMEPACYAIRKEGEKYLILRDKCWPAATWWRETSREEVEGLIAHALVEFWSIDIGGAIYNVFDKISLLRGGPRASRRASPRGR